MKRSLLFIFTLLTITLSAVAQPRISSNKETHHFGQIEWKRPVSVEYTITNTGDKPLVLTNVTTSCACSVANWTKTPIAPGEKGTVSATFDAKALGHFNKSIGIYSNAQMTSKQLHEYAVPDAGGLVLLKTAMQRFSLSARAYDRILKVSRTIADLDLSPNIEARHLAEAINYRNLDRESWGM